MLQLCIHCCSPIVYPVFSTVNLLFSDIQQYIRAMYSRSVSSLYILFSIHFVLVVYPAHLSSCSVYYRFISSVRVSSVFSLWIPCWVVELIESHHQKSPEPVLLNVYGAPELIPRNEFRQPMQPGGPVRKPYSSSVPSPHSLFKNSSSVYPSRDGPSVVCYICFCISSYVYQQLHSLDCQHFVHYSSLVLFTYLRTIHGAGLHF